MSTKLVNNIIFGKNFCRLCFGDVYDDDLRFHDEVILNLKSEKISTMLTNLLGGKYTSNMRVSDSFCSECVHSLKNSYNFMRMCKNNSDRLDKTIVALNEALQSTEFNELSKSVLIQIDTTDYSFMQFYQYRQCAKSSSFHLGHSNFSVNWPTTTKNNSSAQRNNNTVSSRCSVLNTESEDEPISVIKTVVPVKLENSHMENEPETQVKSSLEAQQQRLKSLIQKRTEDNLQKQKRNKYNMERTKSKQQKTIEIATEKLLNIQTEKKQFVCNHCEKIYNFRGSLLYHMRSKHSTRRPYNCKYCDDVFLAPANLRYHIKKYHVDDRAQCDICKARFSQLCDLYIHRKRHFNPKSKYFVKYPPK